MQHFKISQDLKNLNIEKVKNNILNYEYDNKRLKRIYQTTDISESIYSSFKGEVYENLIYELLLLYAKDEEDITRFVLKGPHQNKSNIYNKSGLLIDKSSQIVYKASYKDISEFDALFFTKDSIYFVEMSTSKKTASLNKRLFKKHALLKVLFPTFTIRALIIITEGSVGINNFPDYCTVWVTKDFIDDELLKEIAFNDKKDMKLFTPNAKKFIEANTISYSNFRYFQTLEWILKKVRTHTHFRVDLNFFNAKNLDLYFDIYTKLYIGFIQPEEFKLIVPEYDEKIKNEKIIVTIEKINLKTFDIVYYAKQLNGKLKRLRVETKGVSIKDKDAEGFTNSEVRFMMNILNEEYLLNKKDIEHISKNISIIKPK